MIVYLRWECGGLWPPSILPDAGEADCHVASLLAMTVVFDAFRTKPGVIGYDKYVIANQSADWCGNPSSQCIALCRPKGATTLPPQTIIYILTTIQI